MDLQRLRYFVAVAEELHFTRAAARLYLDQGALSASIRRLERELDLQLFARTSRRVELTPAGNALLPEARRLLHQADRLMETVRDERAAQSGATPSRPVRIGRQCAGLAELTDVLVSVLRTGNPPRQAQITELSFAALFAAADSGQFDAVLGTGGLFRDRDDVTFTPILHDPVVAMCRPDSDLADATVVNASDIVERPAIPLHDLPQPWAEPFTLLSSRNGEPARAAGSVVPRTSREAAELVLATGAVCPTAMSDRLMRRRPDVKAVRIADVPPVVFGVYSFGTRPSKSVTHAAASGPGELVATTAQRVADAFIDLVPGARKAWR